MSVHRTTIEPLQKCFKNEFTLQNDEISSEDKRICSGTEAEAHSGGDGNGVMIYYI